MHHRPAALGRHDQGLYRGLPLLEILLGKLLDIVRGVLEGDELATARPGEWDRRGGGPQSAMMQPGRANVGATMIAHCADHAWLQIAEGHVIRKTAYIQFGVAMTVRITARDDTLFRP
jgi:hypothetical protein